MNDSQEEDLDDQAELMVGLITEEELEEERKKVRKN
eukprot:CAMPEP_0170539926 /NCGR_PEP_ID=MMETSP0209-20121228/104307_1 /TAXON_ID=665100 ORGANISM="Litonotus pictus, Strain P1" /NCGR_SAMPLE_ID=MMETSP0209 /ASSEMBLY_ACC=CAM_ASM_000301 /LENGTH=35 /DNA_ID= /DNA_START= /DNA_END= /DNA_ORIENTATION=